MNPAKRKKLQQAWIESGNPPCKHAAVKAGEICTACGARKPKGRMKPGIEHDAEEAPAEDD